MRFLCLMGVCAAAAIAAALPAWSRGGAGVDPRSDGFNVALGEWSVAPEANAIRPGRVTIVVTNRGRLVHALRIRSTGSGKDRFEVRTRALRPGESARLGVDLPAGTYDVECPVDDGGVDHEERGMHALLEVRADAPLVAPAKASRNSVAIEAFAYKPATLTVKRGATARWTNRDAAPHTVTGASFFSAQLARSESYARKFGRTGRFAYFCALHPQMKGVVVVR